MYGNHHLCLEDDSFSLKGIKDNQFKHKDHSFIVLEWEKCHNDIRKKQLIDPNCDPEQNDECEFLYVDPVCKNEDEIKEWLKHKTLIIDAFNS